MKFINLIKLLFIDQFFLKIFSKKNFLLPIVFFYPDFLSYYIKGSSPYLRKIGQEKKKWPKNKKKSKED